MAGVLPGIIEVPDELRYRGFAKSDRERSLMNNDGLLAAGCDGSALGGEAQSRGGAV
jgi:hypothetical protein